MDLPRTRSGIVEREAKGGAGPSVGDSKGDEEVMGSPVQASNVLFRLVMRSPIAPTPTTIPEALLLPSPTGDPPPDPTGVDSPLLPALMPIPKRNRNSAVAGTER